MAYTTERTWATNDLITAALLNTHLRDNVTFLANPPCCRVYNSGNISVANGGTGTALTFNSERFDTDTMHSTSANTGRITFTTAGKYEVGGAIAWTNSNTTGVRQLQIRVNGTTLIAVDSMDGTSDQQVVSTLYSFSAADYVELIAYQNNGGAGALNVTASGNYSPEFWAIWKSL